MDDEIRRASDALIQAIEAGFSLREIIELAMDDVDASDEVLLELSELHDGS